MTATRSLSKPRELRPQEIVRELLSQPVVLTPPGEVTPARERRVATLERQAPMILDRARNVGAEVEFLGINPLFAEPRLYRGVDSDWVLAPASRREDAIVPRREREALTRLASAHIDFPLIYVAHEVEKEKAKEFLPVHRKSHVPLRHEQAAELVGPVPAPAATLEVGDRLANRSTQVLRAIGRVAPIAGRVALGVVAAPVVLVGGAIAGLATLDPIILGAIPAVTPEPGEPAAWYVLARWEW